MIILFYFAIIHPQIQIYFNGPARGRTKLKYVLGRQDMRAV